MSYTAIFFILWVINFFIWDYLLYITRLHKGDAARVRYQIFMWRWNFNYSALGMVGAIFWSGIVFPVLMSGMEIILLIIFQIFV